MYKVKYYPYWGKYDPKYDPSGGKFDPKGGNGGSSQHQERGVCEYVDLDEGEYELGRLRAEWRVL